MQILDYGVALKSDDGLLLLTKVWPILRTLLLLAGNKSNSYIQSIILQLLILNHQRKHKLPQWIMFRDNSAMFNEEAGELSFSVLARAILADTQKKQIDHLNKIYMSLHDVRNIEVELNAENDDAFGSETKNWRKEIKEDDALLVATRAFLLSYVRDIKGGVFRVYDGTPAGYVSKHAASDHKVVFGNDKAIDALNDKNLFNLQFDKCEKFVNTTFGYNVSHVWPEMAPENAHVNFDLEELQSESDELSEVEVVQPVKASGVPRKRLLPDKNKSNDADTDSNYSPDPETTSSVDSDSSATEKQNKSQDKKVQPASKNPAAKPKQGEPKLLRFKRRPPPRKIRKSRF